jgi:pimeloyl-ACP methyl ester carboxylesterase
MSLNSDQTPVLLIRGLLRESRHWLNFPALLSAQLRRPVFSLDLPGCGTLYQQRSAASIPALRAQLQQQWAKCYPDYQEEAVHLLAISMGGMLALDWALDAPQQVKSLVLINSSSAGLNPFWQRLKPANYFKIMQALIAGPLVREELIWGMTVNKAVDPAIVQQWQQWAIECPVRRSNALRQLWAASRFRVQQAPDCPVFVVSALADQLVSPLCSQMLAERLSSPLLTLADVGHDLPLEATDWLLSVLSSRVYHSDVASL